MDQNNITIQYRIGVFETNSSSCHSCHIQRNDECVIDLKKEISLYEMASGFINIVPPAEYYGWEWYRYCNFRSKLTYLVYACANIRDNIFEVVKELTGCHINVQGYCEVDHDSVGAVASEIAEYASAQKISLNEAILALLINDSCYIQTGNDNSGPGRFIDTDFGRVSLSAQYEQKLDVEKEYTDVTIRTAWAFNRRNRNKVLNEKMSILNKKLIEVSYYCQKSKSYVDRAVFELKTDLFKQEAAILVGVNEFSDRGGYNSPDMDILECALNHSGLFRLNDETTEGALVKLLENGWYARENKFTSISEHSLFNKVVKKSSIINSPYMSIYEFNFKIPVENLINSGIEQLESDFEQQDLVNVGTLYQVLETLRSLQSNLHYSRQGYKKALQGDKNSLTYAKSSYGPNRVLRHLEEAKKVLDTVYSGKNLKSKFFNEGGLKQMFMTRLQRLEALTQAYQNQFDLVKLENVASKLGLDKPK